ncbi:MAG: hypothetical protein ACREJ5_17300 [Geminicoccaceae bacterium]
MSKAEVIQAYERYLQAFLADDIATIDALVQYPLAYIGDGKVSMLDEFPIKPSALMAAKAWHTSVDMAFEVIGVSETKAHLVLKRGTRVRRDGSPIEDVFAFYAWTKTADGWKMFAVSDLTVPR